MSEGASGISLEQQPLKQLPTEPQVKVRRGLKGFFDRTFHTIKGDQNDKQSQEVVEKSSKSEVAPEISKLSRMLYQSYEYSQGSEGLQADLFKYLHNKHPEITMDESEKELVADNIRNTLVNRFLVRNSAATGEMLDTEHDQNVDMRAIRNSIFGNINERMRGSINTMFEELNSTDESAGMDVLIGNVTDGIIARDFVYLQNPDGRPRHGKNSIRDENERFNPFRSHLHYFAGERNNALVPEFTEMFEDVREYFNTKIKSGEWTIDYTAQPTEEELQASRPITKERMLSLMVVRWEETHPGQKFMDAFMDTPTHQMAAD